MVEAVAVHDRDTPRPPVPAAALGDIGDTRIEYARSAGDRAVGEPGAFVGGTAPFVAGDDEALARQLPAFLDIVDVAAEGQPAIGA